MIRAMTVYNGKLYAGISGADAGDGDIVVFDGSSWTVNYSTGTYLRAASLAAHDGKLYAGFGTDVRELSVKVLPSALEVII